MSEVVYMPDGRPAPLVLTAEEAATLLRIESADPSETLRNYRKEGRLRGTQIGKSVRYTLPEVAAFLKRQTEIVAR